MPFSLAPRTAISIGQSNVLPTMPAFLDLIRPANAMQLFIYSLGHLRCSGPYGTVKFYRLLKSYTIRVRWCVIFVLFAEHVAMQLISGSMAPLVGQWRGKGSNVSFWYQQFNSSYNNLHHLMWDRQKFRFENWNILEGTRISAIGPIFPCYSRTLFNDSNSSRGNKINDDTQKEVLRLNLA